MSEKMTREDVARMARECGNDNEHTLQSDMDFLVVFAQKVAAAEREACAKVCEGRIGGATKEDAWWSGFRSAMSQCADVIRARGEK